MSSYLSHDRYLEMGGSADVAAFSRFEFKARRLIDAATHGRVKDETPVRESVTMCAFELVELLAAEESAGGRELAGVSNDGVSISYKTSEDQSTAMRQNRIIRDWLSHEYAANGANLLYCGVDG